MQLNLTEIQYLRGLVRADQIENDYKHNPKAIIDRSTPMYAFTTKVLKKLDEMEDDFVEGKVY